MGLYPRGEASGNKTDKGSSNSSTVLSRKRHRPDTLLFSCGATVLVGEDKAEGHIHKVRDLVKYVNGGFSALQYDSIKYLLCYAAAGLLIKLGLFLARYSGSRQTLTCPLQA